MARIPQQVIEQVLERADVLPVIQQYVALKRAGTSYKGLCPFHGEKTPSFHVTPSRGIFKCFGCGKGGTVIEFLREIEGWSFPEAVRHLAERHGVEIPRESPEEAESERKRREGKKLYDAIMRAARDYFEANLWSEVGRDAREYLQARGVDEVTARAFGLGYASESRHGLLEHLTGLGFKPNVLHRAGVVQARLDESGRPEGGYYDRFRQRVIFPVVDIWGHTIAFGGRILAGADSRAPKYLNSPETAFYTKGDQLYGLYNAKTAISRDGFALLVEGNFDVICLHAQGFAQAVAPMGTALTDHQARLLGRFARRVVVAFDGDRAGEEASLRSIGVFEKAGLEATVVRFDENDDPDSFVRRSGRESFQTRIAEARPLLAWALERVVRPAEGAGIERKIQAIQEAGALLKGVHNTVVWEHYAQDLSRRLSIEPRLMSKYLQRPEHVREEMLRVQAPVTLEPAEHGLLVVLLDQPQWLEEFWADELQNLLASEELSDALLMLREHLASYGQLKAPVLLEQLGHGPMRAHVESALADIGQLYPPDKRVRWYQDCVLSLKRNWAKRTLSHLMSEQEQTDFRRQHAQWQELQRQIEQVNRFKSALEQEGRTRI